MKNSIGDVSSIKNQLRCLIIYILIILQWFKVLIDLTLLMIIYLKNILYFFSRKNKNLCVPI
jgi:hypothetical protein